MKRFVTSQARGQATLLPERLEDFIAEDNPVRMIDAFVEDSPSPPDRGAPLGTIKSWMGYTHALTKTLSNVRT
jgi:hypothetical protein